MVTREDIEGALREGITQRALAERLGVSRWTVRRSIRRLKIRWSNAKRGGPSAGSPPELGDAAALRALYVDEGLTSHQISMRLGVDAQRVRYWLKKHGIPMRTPADYPVRFKAV